MFPLHLIIPTAYASEITGTLSAGASTGSKHGVIQGTVVSAPVAGTPSSSSQENNNSGGGSISGSRARPTFIGSDSSASAPLGIDGSTLVNTSPAFPFAGGNLGTGGGDGSFGDSEIGSVPDDSGDLALNTGIDTSIGQSQAAAVAEAAGLGPMTWFIIILGAAIILGAIAYAIKEGVTRG